MRYKETDSKLRMARAGHAMKRLRHYMGVYLLALGLAPVASLAQTEVRPAAPTDSTANTPRQRVGRVILPEQVTANEPVVAVGPVRPALDPLPQEVKDRVRTFDQYRKEYLRQQELLRKLNKGTTDQDREKIRAQFKEFRERWREQSIATRDQLRERRIELMDRLPNHREILDNVRDQVQDARDKARDAIKDRTDRRGVDK